ncbi:MAG: hypothetical protein GAK40_00528 [Burkholderia plantarii]|nr:MAG: hypothetical protein GAK40_00528 [Burkholderia plantarii]
MRPRLGFPGVALWLALACSPLAGHAEGDRPGEAIVDLFPVQDWDTLGGAASSGAQARPPDAGGGAGELDATPSLADATEATEAAAALALPARAPFEVTGEWRERGHRIVVLDGMGRTFVLCATRCGVSGAIGPGGEIASGFRFATLRGERMVIAADDGTVFELAVPHGQHP